VGEQWNGIVVRSTLSEQGTVPRDALATSPDIALAGVAPFPDPAILTDPANYDTVYGNGLYIGAPNYLYVRGKNGTPDGLSGSWNLFWATPNILLYPYLWQNNAIATSSGNLNPGFSISPGAIGASADPFAWVPSDMADCYCLVAVANTPGYGNPLLGVSDIASLASALALNANIAQHNVHSIRGNLPQVVFESGYDQGDEPALVDVSVIFENIPKGSSYTISAGTPLNGQVLSHYDTNTTQANFTYAWVDLEIPAQWDTMFTCVITFGSDWSGIPTNQKPTVTIRADLVQESSQALYQLGSDAGENPHTGQPRLDSSGGPVRVVTAGSFGVVCPDVGP